MNALAAAPVAEAGLGVMAYVGDTVILNGSASSDPDGSPLIYTWTQVSGAPVDLRRADSDKPEFVVDAPGTLRFELVVSDGLESSAGDTVAVVVPDREALPLGESPGACAAVPSASVAFGLALVALVGRRRR